MEVCFCDFARNVVIFGVDNILHLVLIIEKKNFLALGEEPIHGINDKTGPVAKKWVLTLVKRGQKFVWGSITMMVTNICM